MVKLFAALVAGAAAGVLIARYLNRDENDSAPIREVLGDAKDELDLLWVETVAQISRLASDVKKGGKEGFRDNLPSSNPSL